MKSVRADEDLLVRAAGREVDNMLCEECYELAHATSE